MISSFLDCFGRRSGQVLATAVLAIALMSGIVSIARAQEVPDTTQATPTDVEPARLDSLPSGDLEPPLPSSDSTGVAADTGDTERAFVNADSLSAIRRDGERIQELFGNVFVRQDTTRLRSDYARRYLAREELLFEDNVVIYERGDTLRADTVRYDRTTEVGEARGNVRLTNGDVTVRAERGTYFADEKRSVFPDSVVLVDSSRVLRARHGTYWSDEQRAEFGGRVRLTRPNTTILSDSLTYYRDRDRSVAHGRVFIDRRGGETAEPDSAARTYLFGRQADNRERHRYSQVQGNALLVQIRTDSAGAPTDTLVVQARRLEAFRTDTHRRLVAVDSVRIWQSDLAAEADSVVYDRVVAASPDSAAGQEVPIDTTRPPPDSIGAIAAETASVPGPSARERAEDEKDEEETAGRAEGVAPRSSSDTTTAPPTDATPIPDSVAQARGVPGRGRPVQPWTTPTVQSEEALPLEEIRLFRDPMTWFEDSQVWGDSIRVRLRNRSPDTVFVRGSAFAGRRDSVLERVHQLKARNITAFFRADSLRRIRAQPNAETIRFLESAADSLGGAARASADWVVLRFLREGGRRIKFGPGIEGTWYREPENIPEPFELEGFRWVPQRRPTRGRLLRDERVRRRLDLRPAPRPRPIARQGQRRSSVRPPRAQADSTAVPPSRQARLPSIVPDSVRRQMSGSEHSRADSLRTLARPDSIPFPPRPVAPPDTSETNPNRPQ